MKNLTVGSTKYIQKYSISVYLICAESLTQANPET